MAFITKGINFNKDHQIILFPKISTKNIVGILQYVSSSEARTGLDPEGDQNNH